MKADRERIRGERNQFAEDRDAFKYAAEASAEKFTDISIVNECLTSDLAEARERLTEYGIRRTVPDVLGEHDVHRKALAEAIRAGLHLNWEQLINTARQTYERATEWRAGFEAEKKRADHLQRRLDQSLGLDAPPVLAKARRQPPAVKETTP